ncbi:MAG: tetratricopeptide repeat-containing sensor histidine kinase [Bacteroidota bacterium]
MKKFLLVFFTPFIVSLPLRAQINEIDSLKALLPSVHDTVRMKLYFELSMKYKDNLTDSAKYFANLAIEESRKLKYLKGEADGLISLGRIERDNGELAEGLNLLFKSLNIYREIDDLVQIGNAYNDISIIYAMSDDYEKSLEFFLKSLEMFEKVDDEQGVSYALNNIGIVYQVLGQDSLARAYFIRSLNIKEKNSDTYGIAQAYVNLANVFADYELFDEALAYYFRADSAYALIDNKRGATRNLVYIANMFLEKRNADQALRYASRAYELAKRYNFNVFKQDALQSLVTIAENVGDYRSALKYQKEFQGVRDSLAGEEQIALQEQLKAKFDSEEKDRKIELLKNKQLLDQAQNDQQRLTNYLLMAGLMFLVIIISILGWGYAYSKKKNQTLKELNKEKDQFISILSHDIKGPLNTLKGFTSILTHDSEKLSKEELTIFGGRINDSVDNLLKLINGILDWFYSKNSPGALTYEHLNVSQLVDDVIRLYKLTADQKSINVINKIEPGIGCFADRNTLLTVLRNLLSNAVKYSKNGDSIRFDVSQLVNQIKIIVTDTGVGISKADLPHLFEYSKSKVRKGTNAEIGSGLGLALSKDLIESNGGELSVESIEGEGSRFMITLPVS